jgi:hypothetical protein
MHQRLSFLMTGGSKASERASFHIAFALFFPLFGFVLQHIDLEIPNIFRVHFACLWVFPSGFDS